MKENIQNMLEKINKAEAQLLDVREVEEWEAGHLKLAHLVPLSKLRDGDEPGDSIDRDIETYLHCRSGNRVMEAMPLLQGMGFSEIVPLKEGFDELMSEGLESTLTRVELNRLQSYQFEFKNGLGKTAILDGPKSIGGGEDGLRPMEMLLGGVAACSSFDILSILLKAKQEIDDFRVVVKAKRSEEVPKVYTHIHLEYHLRGKIEESHLKRAIDLSLEKYCSAAAMLAKTAKIDYSWKLG